MKIIQQFHKQDQSKNKEKLPNVRNEKKVHHKGDKVRDKRSDKMVISLVTINSVL